jgi:hypothetical protein
MEPRTFLRVEGVAVLAIALGSYFSLDGSPWVLIALALAPDLSMLGYLAGPKVGSLSYNVIHTYALPLAVGSMAVWFSSRLALLLALIWIGHIGADRLFGYGLKFDSGFADTHLSAQPAPTAAFIDSGE